MKNRLSRIIKPKDNRTVMLAVDHGYFMGPTTGLEKLDEMVNPLLPFADTLMLTRGALRNYIAPEIDVPIVLRVSGGTSILNDNLLHEGIITSMEEAVRLNVAGVAFSRSEEHTSELQSHSFISYAVFCLKKKKILI